MFGNISLWSKLQSCVTQVDGGALNGSFKEIIYSCLWIHSQKESRSLILQFLCTSEIVIFTKMQRLFK